MINYFLQQQTNLSPQVKHIIKTNIAKPHKFQPFHIDCQHTKRKICYCVNNPVLNIEMDSKIKQQMWQKYQDANDFYLGINQQDKKKAKQQISNIKTKIQCLSKSQVADFVRSITKQKNLIGQMIEY